MDVTEAADDKIGKILGSCRIDSKLGQGGMGAVYKGIHLGLDKEVAVKVLPESMTRDATVVRRFSREAKSAARLEHPNIVGVMNVGRHDGLYYIIMQFVDGENLADVLAREGPLRPEKALSIAFDVASALHYAHERKIVHRDIKPENIMIARDGQVKVTDFGLARDVDQSSSISSPGTIMGTPFFMSPEQARGDTVDRRSDIYSLGTTLYYVLTGRLPFKGDTAVATIMKHISDPPPPLQNHRPDLPEALCNFVLGLMEKAPQDRPASMAEVADQIRNLLAGLGVETSGTLTFGGGDSVGLRGWFPYVLGILLMLGAGSLLAGVLLSREDNTERAEKLFRAAESQAAESPDAAQENMKMFRKVAKACAGTEVGERAKREADRYRKLSRSQRKIRELKVMKDARRYVDDNRLPKAMAMLDGFAKTEFKGKAPKGEFDAFMRYVRLAVAFDEACHSMRFAGVLQTAKEYPPAYRRGEWGKEVGAIESNSRAGMSLHTAVLSFITSVQSADVQALWNKFRPVRTGDDTVFRVHLQAMGTIGAAGRKIGVTVDEMRFPKDARQGKVTWNVTLSAFRKKTIEWTETLTWYEDKGNWRPKAPSGNKWVRQAVDFRLVDYCDAINSGKQDDLEGIILIAGEPAKVERVKKFMLGGLSRAREGGFKLLAVTATRIDVLANGLVRSECMQRFRGAGKSKEHNKKITLNWSVSGGRFVIVWPTDGKSLFKMLGGVWRRK
jgi:serine/threonine protein kinase